MKRKTYKDRRDWREHDVWMVAQMNAKTGPWGKPHIDFYKPKTRKDRTYRRCAHCFLPVVEQSWEFRLRRQPCSVQAHPECVQYIRHGRMCMAMSHDAGPRPDPPRNNPKKTGKKRDRRRPSKPTRRW